MTAGSAFVVGRFLVNEPEDSEPAPDWSSLDEGKPLAVAELRFPAICDSAAAEAGKSPSKGILSPLGEGLKIVNENQSNTENISSHISLTL